MSVDYNLLEKIRSMSIDEQAIFLGELINNGDLVCGTSMIVNDNDTQQEYICANLVQFRYENQVFKEVHRKKNVHEDVISKIIEIVNHKGINEFATISYDGSFRIWD